MKLPIAILAGGLATRLHPVTLNVPKALIPINGHPFIQWQLELLAKQGVNYVVLCLGYKASEIVDFVGDGRQYGLNVEYSIEKTRLGTGGAIKNASKLLGENFGVLYGDSYLPINFLAVFDKFQLTDKSVLMTVYKNDNKFDTSNVLVQADGSLIYSKNKKLATMTHIDYGFSVLNRDALGLIAGDNQSDLSETLESLSLNGQVVGFEVQDRFYEIGSFEGILELEDYLRRSIK
jgi:N-acetyl-alpha-D-muramate 1-phosphate uridylyltransferase